MNIDYLGNRFKFIGTPNDNERAQYCIEFRKCYVESEIDGDVLETAKYLIALHAEVVEAYKGTPILRVEIDVSINLDDISYSDDVYINDTSKIIVVREETDDEWEARKVANKKKHAKVKAERERVKKLKEEKERELYEKMKAKFGDE